MNIDRDVVQLINLALFSVATAVFIFNTYTQYRSGNKDVVLTMIPMLLFMLHAIIFYMVLAYHNFIELILIPNSSFTSWSSGLRLHLVLAIISREIPLYLRDRWKH